MYVTDYDTFQLQFAISEFRSGVWEDQVFYEHVNKKVFNSHIKSLERFEKTFADIDLLTTMGQKLMRNVRYVHRVCSPFTTCLSSYHRRRAGAGDFNNENDGDILPQAMFDAMRSNYDNAEADEDADYCEPQDDDDY